MTVVSPVTAPPVGARPAPPTAGMAASTWLRPVLVGPDRPVRIVAAGPRAAYGDLGDGTAVAIEAAGGAGLPNAVRVAALPRLDGQVGTIGAGMLQVGPWRARVGRWWDARPRVPRLDRPPPAALRRNRAALPDPDRAHIVRYGLAGPVAALRAAAVTRDAGALGAVLDDLIGRGPGSTPSGDDVVAGLLATLVTLGPADGPVAAFAERLADGSEDRSGRTTSLSATLLRCAADGAVAAAAGRVLSLLAAPCGRPAWPSAVTALASLGHTSGRDLLAGIAVGVDALLAEGDQA